MRNVKLIIAILLCASFVFSSIQLSDSSCNLEGIKIISSLDNDSNEIFWGKLIREEVAWCDLEDTACTIFYFKTIDNIRGDYSSIKEVRCLAVRPDTTMSLIKNLPFSAVRIKIDPNIPEFDCNKEYVIFGKSVFLSVEYPVAMRDISAYSILNSIESEINVNGSQENIADTKIDIVYKSIRFVQAIEIEKILENDEPINNVYIFENKFEINKFLTKFKYSL